MRELLDAISLGKSVLLAGPDSAGKFEIARDAFKTLGAAFQVIDPFMSLKRARGNKPAILQNVDMFSKKLLAVASTGRVCVALTDDPTLVIRGFDKLKVGAATASEPRVPGVLETVFAGEGGEVDRFHFPRQAAFNIPSIYEKWAECKQTIDLLAAADRFKSLGCYQEAVRHVVPAPGRPVYKKMVKT
jgi:hypothetical protein